jgi:Spy/CpxP family protein refolding chaperone
MRSRYTKALLSIAAVAALAAPAAAQARHGSDDPPSAVRHEQHTGNDRRDRDDIVNHDRPGSDDGPNPR